MCSLICCDVTQSFNHWFMGNPVILTYISMQSQSDLREMESKTWGIHLSRSSSYSLFAASWLHLNATASFTISPRTHARANWNHSRQTSRIYHKRIQLSRIDMRWDAGGQNGVRRRQMSCHSSPDIFQRSFAVQTSVGRARVPNNHQSLNILLCPH